MLTSEEAIYKLNWAHNFIDPLTQAKFDKFFVRRKYLKVIHFFNFFHGGLTIPMCIGAMFVTSSFQNWLYSALVMIMGLIIVMSGLLIVREKSIPTKYDNWLRFVRRIYFVFSSAIVVLISCRKFIVECDVLPESSRYYFHPWHCEEDAAIVPGFSIALLSILPIAAIICLNETRLDFVLLVMFVTDGIFFVILSIFAPSIFYLWKDLAFSAFVMVFHCIDEHSSRIEFFIACDKLEATLAENRRMQEENRAAELRSMIGNLTHDLKTPLSSFMSGIDIMAHNISQIVSTMKDAELSMFVSMQSQFDSLLQCFKNIRNTNMFMLMTINRCLDYTKASKGLKLTPKYETVDLMETLSMPLQCMKNIQDRIPIEMAQLGAEICSHVITDKQWLQENILCLLSNAVKYSSDGIVNISVNMKAYSDELRTDSATLLAYRDSIVVSGNLKNVLEFPFSSRLRQTVYAVEGSSIEVNQVRSSIAFTESLHSQKIYPILTDDNTQTPPDEESNDKAIQSISQKQYLRFEISDHGIGLTEEGMKNLFSPFQQAQKLAGGTGLGLYSLAKRMDAIKGHYGVEPRRDGQKGSIFWFEIPYRPDGVFAQSLKFSSPEKFRATTSCLDDETDELRKSAEIADIGQTKSLESLEQLLISIDTSIKLSGLMMKPSMSDKQDSQLNIKVNNNSQKNNEPNSQGASVSNHNKKKGLNILIADDSPPISKMISMMLRQQHHLITLAQNGEVAYQKMLKHFEEHGKGYDMVLMDLQMPVLDGLEATRRFRSLEKEKRENDKDGDGVTGRLQQWQQQVIIGMSANSDEETIQEAFNAGVNEFITKPFQMDTFAIVAQKVANGFTTT